METAFVAGIGPLLAVPEVPAAVLGVKNGGSPYENPVGITKRASVDAVGITLVVIGLKWHVLELGSSPGPISESVRIHDVFLSFRGVDTRSTFVSHLYTALRNAGIKVFQDDSGLQRGDYISTSLFRAIEESQISLIVFSKNYANSKWCLDELEKIMKCYRTIGQKVVPVFYHLEPSEVRHQTGEFGISFHSLLYELLPQTSMFRSYNIRFLTTKIWNKKKFTQDWREALRQAASIAGFEILKSRNESEYIKAIVDHISDLLNKTDLFISDNPVGIQSRVKDVINCLDFGSNGVQLVGMWGMGGIGKTTIAKAVYNKIGREFEGRSFLANIREVWKQDGRQMGLQEQLLFDICKEITKISYIDKGKNTLKDKLCGKRVLIVLDDVSTLDQLNTLCASREWFGKGSVIIITTRDLVLLRGRVDRIYIMTVMNESESIELFSWNAFKQARPKVDFSEISMNVVKYSGGLPLALEVLGRYLFARGVTEWQRVLEKLKRIPNDQVQKKLRISYDDLEDTDEQEIFLDIASFLIGMDRNDVILILNDCGLHAEIGISVLVERSLVSVDDKNRLGMHDLLRDMGRGIVHEESPKSPEKRSRLLYPEDVIDVLSKQTGKESVMGLALKLPKANKYCKAMKTFRERQCPSSVERIQGITLHDALHFSFSHFMTYFHFLYLWLKFKLKKKYRRLKLNL
ncbi:disease resistance protein RPV1-like [Medicago truncatula]|uniref:disease resistance protein RPV1-like n=1 Tax=Medicago truncatula TaxID=3880 RepID=UPI001967D91E|nr:disease resistance protein RPV1-like [Medicago truncatula]